MTAAQEPRAGEVLTAESVKLLRAGDVLRARSSFHNPDILTKGDIVIVQSIGDDAGISFQNLFRASPPCGLTANRFVFVHRPPIRLRADYSHMASRPSESSASVGGEADRIEYLRASRDGHAARSHQLFIALTETRNRVETWPLDDTETCMFGSSVDSHDIGSGHSPVTQADHARSLILEAIDEALRTQASAREGELTVLLDNLVIAQSLSRELRTAATDQARAYLYDYRRPAALRQHQEGEGQ